MKLSEFLNHFRMQEASKMADVKILRYIPFDEKISILKNSEKELLSVNLSGMTGMTEFVKEKEKFRFFRILLAYTDLEVDDTSIEMYDACLAIDMDRFFTHYCKVDYERFCKMFDDIVSINDGYMLRDALMSVGTESIDEQFHNIVEELGQNAGMFANLNEILRINNLGLNKK